MSSSYDVSSNFSQRERLRPLHSSLRRHHLPRLPSFSEFISLTFPQYALHRRNVAQGGTIVLSKLHPNSQLHIPTHKEPNYQDIIIGEGLNRTLMPEKMQTAGMESVNRTGFPRGRVHKKNFISKEELRNSAQNASVLDNQLDNDNGSLHTSKCSSLHETFYVSDIGGKDAEQRKGNSGSTTGPYVCPFCPVVLMYQKHLIAHVKEKHEQKKPFGCPRDGCWQRFGGLGDMNRHIKTVHNGEKRFSCDLCARSFSRRSGLKRHAHHVHRGDD